MCMSALLVCMCMRTMWLPGAHGSHEKVSDALERVIDGCEAPCRFWEANMGPLQEQQFS